MSIEIDKLLSESKFNEAVQQSLIENKSFLSELLSHCMKSTGIKLEPKLKSEVVEVVTPTIVGVTCGWLTNSELRQYLNKYCKGRFTWNNIKIVCNDIDKADYVVIINKPSDEQKYNFDDKKVILFRMEPNMASKPDLWGEWADPDPTRKRFLHSGYHDVACNNLEWHLSKSYNQLMTEEIIKDTRVAGILSSVISAKYYDIGHIKRVDFIKFLETKGFIVDVYGTGGDRFMWKNNKGPLPQLSKDDGMIPYKYTFNVENNSIRNYVTEKLVDGILAECLTFYHGCVNVKEIIDERAYVWLELIDFEKDFNIIKTAISENWWEQRIDIIRKEKKRILTELQFFPRIESIIKNKNIK